MESMQRPAAFPLSPISVAVQTCCILMQSLWCNVRAYCNAEWRFYNTNFAVFLANVTGFRGKASGISGNPAVNPDKKGGSVPHE